jgi:hypothetical protein
MIIACFTLLYIKKEEKNEEEKKKEWEKKLRFTSSIQ